MQGTSYENLLDVFRVDLEAFGLSRRTLNSYLPIVRKFLRFSGGEVDRASIASFLASLREDWKPSSVRQAYYVLRRFLDAVGEEVDLPRLKFEEGEIERRVIPREAVEKMVESAEGELRAYLALSTTWGFRRVELAEITTESFQDGKIVVKSAKGGELRVHKIPEGLEWLAEHPFEPKPLSTLSALFKRALLKAGFPLEDYRGYGWHSIRSALVTGLVQAGLDPVTIFKFMGWKGGRTRLALPIIYTRMEGEEIDERVYKSHPFLPLWGG